MSLVLVTVIATVILFGTAILIMAIGLILRGKILRGGCGSATGKHGEIVGCDACSKKALNLCDEDDAMGLAGPSFTGTLGRFEKRGE